MKLIIGLGNPEPKYDKTRHNIGFMCLNDFAKVNNLTFSDKFNAKMAEYFVNGEKVILIKPYNYMNVSGQVVKKFVDFYNIDVKDIIVIYDDLALDYATIKLKYSSSHGGHNGIKDMINHLGTKDIFRIKVGINSPYKKNGRDFVLSQFSKEEQKQLSEIYVTTNRIIESFIKGNSREDIMNIFN